MEPDSGTTNVRNTASSHWKRWLVESRCLVPITSFSEFDHGAKQDVWFALSPDRPLAFCAKGILRPPCSQSTPQISVSCSRLSNSIGSPSSG